MPLVLLAPGNEARVHWRGRPLGRLPIAAFLLVLLPLPVILYFALRHWLARIDERVGHLRELQTQQSLREQAELALHDREVQLSAIFTNALEAMVLVDDDRQFLDANPAACALLGATAGDLVGATIDQFVAPDVAQAMPHRWPAFLETGLAKGEWRIKDADGNLTQEVMAPVVFVPLLSGMID